VLKKPLKSKRNEEEYSEKKYCLDLLKEKEKLGEINLFYSDESSFQRNSNLPYQWSKKGYNTFIESYYSKNFSITGFLSNKLKVFSYYIKEEKIKPNALYFIQTIKKFLKENIMFFNKKTYIVLDNAPIHRAKIVKEYIDSLKTHNIFFFFLPPYSPELNLIERSWKHIKENIPAIYRCNSNIFFDKMKNICYNYFKSTNYVNN
jgi:transposase